MYSTDSWLKWLSILQSARKMSPQVAVIQETKATNPNWGLLFFSVVKISDVEENVEENVEERVSQRQGGQGGREAGRQGGREAGVRSRGVTRIDMRHHYR